LADESDDNDVRVGVTRNHSEQRRFADACAGEQADTLALAYSEQTVDSANAGREWPSNRGSGERIGRRSMHGPLQCSAVDLATVDWAAEPAEDPADEPFADTNGKASFEAAHDTASPYHAQLADRHEQCLVPSESDDFGKKRLGAQVRSHLAKLADPRLRQRR